MNKNFNLENAKSIIAEASGVPVNTTFGSITKPIDLLLEVIDMSADLIALIHEETELKKHHRAYLHVHEELEDCADQMAERMQEKPGSKEYGALSLAVQYYAKPEIVANVPPNCFMPRPNVGSAVIRLTRHEKPPVEVEDEKLMFRIIRASFIQRRKTLANGLNNSPEIHLPKEVIQESIVSLGVPENIRGEALSLEQFAELSNEIGQRMKQ